MLAPYRGMIRSDSATLRCTARDLLQCTPWPEADLQQTIARPKLKRSNRGLVLSGCLHGHDLPKQEPNPPLRAGRLTGDEGGPPHETKTFLSRRAARTPSR